MTCIYPFKDHSHPWNATTLHGTKRKKRKEKTQQTNAFKQVELLETKKSNWKSQQPMHFVSIHFHWDFAFFAFRFYLPSLKAKIVSWLKKTTTTTPEKVRREKKKQRKQFVVVFHLRLRFIIFKYSGQMVKTREEATRHTTLILLAVVANLSRYNKVQRLFFKLHLTRSNLTNRNIFKCLKLKRTSLCWRLFSPKKTFISPYCCCCFCRSSLQIKWLLAISRLDLTCFSDS